jgi:CRISPR-associated endonuclease Csn1
LVRQALIEVRKVVNAILRELVYGQGHTLERIHIELAREVKGTAMQRAKRSKEMRDRERQRSAIADRLRDDGIRPTRDAISRYLLWEEQGHVCIYSGQTISRAQLFEGGNISIDHILPRSRSLDDSAMNKVLCLRDENEKKGDRTPAEWLAGMHPEKYEQMLQRARKLPYRKFQRFYREDVELDEFLARQFVDTTYITSQVRGYVQSIAPDVQCTKGQHTAELRHQWGLESVLQELGDSPAWVAASELRPGEKNRLDHRHHAVDAILIALTNRTRLQELAALWRRRGSGDRRATSPEPWPHFRACVEGALRSINVSHRVRRKISGALHADTTYGQFSTGEEDGTHKEYVYRKPVESLSTSLVTKIRDRAVRELVENRLREHGIKPGRGGGKIPADVWKEPLILKGKRGGSGTIVRKVRICIRSDSIRPIRGGKAYIEPANTHHICLFEVPQPAGETSRDAVYVSMLEAAEIIREQHRYPEANALRNAVGCMLRWRGVGSPRGAHVATSRGTPAHTLGDFQCATRRAAHQFIAHSLSAQSHAVLG